MRNLFIFLLALAVQGCATKKAGEETKEEVSQNTVVLNRQQLQNARIDTGRMESRPVSSVLRVNGTIEVPPQNLLSVSAPLGGYVKSIRLIPGMYVRKGQAVAVVEDIQYIQLQQDYLTARSRLNFLKNEYQRQRDLNESKASSDKVLDQSAAEYQSHLVLLRSLEEKLRLCGINAARLQQNNISRSLPVYAPANGYVSKVNVHTGQYAAPTDVLFEIIDPTDIHLTLKVFEKDLSRIAPGQALLAYTNNKPEVKYPATISLIGRDIDSERSAEVHCHLKHFDRSLVPGTYMNAEIEVRNHTALVLPEEAIVRFEGKQYGFIAQDSSHFEMVELTTGTKDKGWVEIAAPGRLSEETFVTKGAYTLLMSLKNKAEE